MRHTSLKNINILHCICRWMRMLATMLYDLWSLWSSDSLTTTYYVVTVCTSTIFHIDSFFAYHEIDSSDSTLYSTLANISKIPFKLGCCSFWPVARSRVHLRILNVLPNKTSNSAECWTFAELALRPNYLHASMGLASTSSVFRLEQGRKIGEGTFVSRCNKRI